MTSSPNSIAVRAYTESATQPFKPKRQISRKLDQPSPYTLVFDTETTTDAAQALRVGFYQLRYEEKLVEEGAFYQAQILSEAELAKLNAYCDRNKLALRSVGEFNESIFLRHAYDGQALVAGFNLPFDISRIALRHGSARGNMRGGFSFVLSPSRYQPYVRVKHLSARASLIDFAVPGRQETARSSRKRGFNTDKHRGYFIDLKTLAAALTSRSFSLESLCSHLGVKTQKHSNSEHGQELTETYLDYARTDVQASWECLCALLKVYQHHNLNIGPHRILSEASIGKAYLDKMGVAPLGSLMDVPRHIFAKAMESYYGGRAEVRIRRQLSEVVYCDFKSMYPTVNSLMGLWQFVISDGMRWHDTTIETQEFLANTKLADLQKKETWRQLRTLVRVAPDDDLFPVRARYDQSKPSGPHTIGLNYLTCSTGLWYTLADAIAAKLLSDKCPKILEAISFVPREPQMGLKPLDLFGNPDFRINPRTDDAFKRLIDLRDQAKAVGDKAEKAIKIIANSTSYGIFIEILRDNAPKPERLNVFNSDGAEREYPSTAIEQPGRYFHPLIGTLITGAARLMLGLAERLTLDRQLNWAFCDTDSLAISRPEEMEFNQFHDRVREVVDWFKPLNPYVKPGSILQIEDVNFHPDKTGKLQPLFAFAISAKRYALCNFDETGRPIIRKASAHGLGHLVPPYGNDDPADGIPSPVVPLNEIGVNRWQYDLWCKIIEAALTENPWKVALDYHPKLGTPAASRYSATSPELLKWMRSYNSQKPEIEQVRPFGFMLRFYGKSVFEEEFPVPNILEVTKPGRPKRQRLVKASAPFDRNLAIAVDEAFDRDTGESLLPGQLRSYVDVLRHYHLSPENKFQNADHYSRGQTQRRHVIAETTILMGKEANAIDAEGALLPTDAKMYRQFCRSLANLEPSET